MSYVGLVLQRLEFKLWMQTFRAHQFWSEPIVVQRGGRLLLCDSVSHVCTCEQALFPFTGGSGITKQSRPSHAHRPQKTLRHYREVRIALLGATLHCSQQSLRVCIPSKSRFSLATKMAFYLCLPIWMISALVPFVVSGPVPLTDILCCASSPRGSAFDVTKECITSECVVCCVWTLKRTDFLEMCSQDDFTKLTLSTAAVQQVCFS